MSSCSVVERALGGPIALTAAHRLGAVDFLAGGWAGLVALGLVWATGVGILAALFGRISRREPLRYAWPDRRTIACESGMSAPAA